MRDFLNHFIFTEGVHLLTHVNERLHTFGIQLVQLFHERQNFIHVAHQFRFLFGREFQFGQFGNPVYRFFRNLHDAKVENPANTSYICCRMTRKAKKRLILGVGIPVLLLTVFVIWFRVATRMVPPPVADKSALETERTGNGNFLSIGRNKLQKNEFGLWEMYVEGDPFSRGAVFGRLNRELIFQQEKAFVDQIKVLVPSASYLKFLRYLLAFMNRGMDKHIPVEYLEEIYGISFSHPDTFDFVGGKYNRVLNYHAAHDIGHALRQYMLVGCTSFSAWGGMSEDSSLIVGRNFDFFVGDDFARNKTVAFFNPDKGNKFMTVTWPGFIGAVSGMNEHGLTVTLNAAASDPPLSVKTPIAILAREILQYASDIDEAFAIAQKRETFVSETIMVGSAKDGQSALIEKTPRKTVLFRSADEKLICSNHYQSPEFAADKANQENIRTSDSPSRYRVMEELFDRYGAINAAEAALMLRERGGEGGTNQGLGNQKAVNQLIAHHAVIFRPHERKVWVSAPPYQLGAFVCYDLNEVFSRFPEISGPTPMHVSAETIPPDPFLKSSEYRGYENFRRLKSYVSWFATRPKYQLDEHVLTAFEGSNPLYYHTHELLGDYYASRGQKEKALVCYDKALSLEIATLQERESIEKRKQKLSK